MSALSGLQITADWRPPLFFAGRRSVLQRDHMLIAVESTAHEHANKQTQHTRVHTDLG